MRLTAAIVLAVMVTGSVAVQPPLSAAAPKAVVAKKKKKKKKKAYPKLSVASGKGRLSKEARAYYESDNETASFSVTGCYAENKQRVTCLVTFTSINFGSYWSVCKVYETAYVTNRSSKVGVTVGRLNCVRHGG